MSAQPDVQSATDNVVDLPSAAPHRVYPSNVRLEAALLGGLVHDQTVLGEVDPDDFYRPEYAAIARLLHEMAAASVPIDSITLLDWAQRSDRTAARFDGVSFLVELADRAPPSASLPYYAKRLRVLAQHRRDIARLEAVVDRLYDAPEEGLDDRERLALLGDSVIGLCAGLSRKDVAQAVDAALTASGRPRPAAGGGR